MKGLSPIVIFCWALGWISLWSQEPYREPDFKTALLDGASLDLNSSTREDLTRALTALGRNFPDDPEVSSRVKAMGVLLAWHLQPEDRDAVVANYFLRRGIPPTPTAHYREKANVISLLEKTLSRRVEAGKDDRLNRLLTDVLDELLGRELSKGLAWLRTVAPPPRPLARETAEVAFIDAEGAWQLWRAKGQLLDEPMRQPRIQGPKASMMQFLAPSIREKLEERYPYVLPRLHMEVEGTGTDSAAGRERDTLLELLIGQLVDGWEWDASLALCGVGLAGAPPFPDLLNRLDKHLRRGDTREARVIMIPRRGNPGVFFRDWMALEQMHRVVATEFITAGSADDVTRWHAGENAEFQEARALFRECRRYLGGGRLLTPRRLVEDRRVYSRLQKMTQLMPSHESAAALWTYAHLSGELHASVGASLAWLDAIADKVTPLRPAAYTPRFKEELGLKAVDRLRAMRSKLDPRTKPLATALEHFLEKHALPFCRVKNKQTATAKLQFKKLVRAISEWRVLYNQYATASRAK